MNKIWRGGTKQVSLNSIILVLSLIIWKIIWKISNFNNQLHKCLFHNNDHRTARSSLYITVTTHIYIFWQCIKNSKWFCTGQISVSHKIFSDIVHGYIAANLQNNHLKFHFKRLSAMSCSVLINKQYYKFINIVDTMIENLTCIFDWFLFINLSYI